MSSVMNKWWVGREKCNGGNMLQQWNKQSLLVTVVRENVCEVEMAFLSDGMGICPGGEGTWWAPAVTFAWLSITLIPEPYKRLLGKLKFRSFSSFPTHPTGWNSKGRFSKKFQLQGQLQCSLRRVLPAFGEIPMQERFGPVNTMDSPPFKLSLLLPFPFTLFHYPLFLSISPLSSA